MDGETSSCLVCHPWTSELGGTVRGHDYFLRCHGLLKQKAIVFCLGWRLQLVPLLLCCKMQVLLWVPLLKLTWRHALDMTSIQVYLWNNNGEENSLKEDHTYISQGSFCYEEFHVLILQFMCESTPCAPITLWCIVSVVSTGTETHQNEVSFLLPNRS